MACTPLSLFAIRYSLFLVLLAVASCADKSGAWNLPSAKKPPPEQPEPPAESNIVRVNKFFSQNPWLSFKSDGSGTVDGVSFTIYLESATQPKGVFGTGTIVVTMYRLGHDPLGREVVSQIHEWVLPPPEAYRWRSTRASAMGWGYGPRLQWPDSINVGGKQVAFIVKYVREDGRAISSSRQVLKVPVTGTVMTPTPVNASPVVKPTPSRAQ